MDQQFCDCRPVLLIWRHLQFQLNSSHYEFITTCYQNSTRTGAHLRENFVDPERAGLFDWEGRKEAYSRTRMYHGVQDVSQHV